MLKVLIVEDQKEQAMIIRDMIALSHHASCISTEIVCDLQSLQDSLKPGAQEVDIVLMDVRLGDEDGVEVVKRHFATRTATQVIYVTGYPLEYCTKVYQTPHTYFLSKPVKQADLEDALSKAIDNLESLTSKPITIIKRGTLTRIFPTSVMYIESDRRKIRIHTNQDIIEAYYTLADIKKRLPRNFVQCHKSFLVNSNYITEMKGNQIRLLTGEVIPVSQRKRNAVRDEVFLQAHDRL